MLILVTLATLLVATIGAESATQEAAEQDCGSGWMFIHRACYRFSSEALSWDDALLSCQTEGGHLLSISDMSEKNKMRAEVRKLDSKASWWVGLKHKGGNAWEWLDKGSPFTTKVTPWDGDQPLKGGMQDCVDFNSNGKISDDSCATAKAFICERHEITQRPAEYTTIPVTTIPVTSPTTSLAVGVSESPSTSTPATTAKTTNAATKPLEPNTKIPEPTSLSTTRRSSSASTSTPTSTSATTSTSTSTTITTTVFIPSTTTTSDNINVAVNENQQTKNSTNFKGPDQMTMTVPHWAPTTTMPTTSSMFANDGDADDDDGNDKRNTNNQANGQSHSNSQGGGGSNAHSQGSGQPSIADNTKTTTKPTVVDNNKGGDTTEKNNTKTTTKPTVNDNNKGGDTTEKNNTKTTTKPTVVDNNKGGDTTEKNTEKEKTNSNKRDQKEEREEEVDLFALYEGCYVLNTRKDLGKPFLYTLGSSTCPTVTASHITWPETQAERTREARCKHGNGLAYFHCGGNPVCWQNVPDIDNCASPSFKRILQAASSFEKPDNVDPPKAEEAVAITMELVNATVSDDITAEDVMATSKVIKSLVRSGFGEKIMNKTEVKNIVKNVMRAGSNLVASNKTRVWTEMTKQDKVRSATSLMVAMETATVAMAEELDEPTVITTRDENIELELRVLDVSSKAAEDQEDVVYNAEGSENEFSIPIETISHLSKGKLAKVVFMTHYTMGDILDDDAGDRDNDVSLKNTGDAPQADGGDNKAEKKMDSKPAPRLASYILSASVGGSTKPHFVKLPQPVTFTMTHIRSVPQGYHSLCSFWSISESGLGAWSQDGCRVMRSNANQTTCECDHMTNFAVLMAIQEVEISDTHVSLLRLTTIVGCIISCLCLLASWITFTCFTSLQGERNSIHKNLVVCLFVAEMLFLTGIDQTQNRLACGLVAGFLHYFFLAAFLWMLLEGVHIVLMLVQVFDASRSRLPYYYASAYAPPLLIIAISAGLYYQGYGTERYCWLTTEHYFIWSFVGPVAVILFVNAVILIYAMTMVCRHSEYVFSGKEKNTAGGIRSWIQGALALEVLLGLTWILGYFFINTQTLPVAYIFTVLNSLQGLFIFCFHCLFNKKARKEYRRVMKVKRRPSSATSSGAGTQSASLKHKHDLSHDAHQHHTAHHSNA